MSVSGVTRRVSRELAEESRMLLAVFPLPGGALLAKCRSCPKNTRDFRGDVGGKLSAGNQRNHALSSAYSAPSNEMAEAWFEAHRRTDFHAYYLDPPTRGASEAQALAAIFGAVSPAAEVIPFPYARKWRSRA